MSMPRFPEAQRFHRLAVQRFEAARYLLDGGFTTVAVYLAGIAVECGLKALTLDVVPKPRRDSTLESFKGKKAHDFEWLRSLYYLNGGHRFPSDMSRAYPLVNEIWSIDLRYDPRRLRDDDAAEFVALAEDLRDWFRQRYTR